MTAVVDLFVMKRLHDFFFTSLAKKQMIVMIYKAFQAYAYQKVIF